jgi:hypothetical protein
VTLDHRVSTSAVVLADGSLSVSHEVEYEVDDRGPRYEVRLAYRVPPEQVGELLASLPESFEELDAAMRWASSHPQNASAFRSALRGFEPALRTASWVS